MTFETKVKIFKWSTYVLVGLAFLCIQSDPYLTQILGSRPNILLPYAVFVAIYEDSYDSAMFGAFIGLLMDYSMQNISGFLGFLMLGLCYGVSTLTHRYFKTNFKNAIIVLASCILIFEAFNFIFRYSIMYNNAGELLSLKYYGVYIYTIIIAPIVYLITKKLNIFLNRRVN